ncbi:diguanylate cyclase [Methylobacterium sp. 4-46]|uniref:GGDEF domain-containing protein n=1 Tax=unclassified Methylobacterium TaxID=2615210 RepID=UPI000152D91F|nr:MULTISPECIES: GGDEF domain-containing protein [Methylobacterium]ACA17253.1 diguanylate cyclase [Methylobacterium sp. 4-46]WFT82939.1 GGDEF domain-containing protein [Methylobacterium nodulans]
MPTSAQRVSTRASTPQQDGLWSYLQALVATTLDTIREHGLHPSPAGFELLFRHHSRALPDADLGPLLARVRSLAQHGSSPPLPEIDLDAVHDGAEVLESEAGRLAAALSGSAQALATYGSVLSACNDRLGAAPSAAMLMQSVALLTRETARVSARNAELEGELRQAGERIGKLQRNLASVRQEASVDALTGIANRRAFTARLRRQLAQAKAEGAGPFCLVLLDVDHFKLFNDAHGHRTGDQVLRLVARLLTDNVKGRDFVARYGGEEFALILSDVDAESGLTVAEQICERLRGKRLIKRETGRDIGALTLSGGLAQARPGEAQGALIERADAALYAAKGQGRDRICLA